MVIQGKNAPNDGTLAQNLSLVVESARKLPKDHILHQILPRQGLETQKHISEYVKLIESMEGFFAYVDSSVSYVLPKRNSFDSLLDEEVLSREIQEDD